MSRRVRFVVLCAALAGFSCSSAPPPSAADSASKTLREMLVLAEAGDWTGYVDRYYGESVKFRSDEDRLALIRRFEGSWGPEVLAALRKAATVPPEIVDGNRAEFRVGKDVAFTLFRTADGGWTFHL